MKRERVTRIAIFLFCLALFSFKAGDIGLQFTGDENFYFESSRRMAESGDWLTPQYYAQKRFQKPFLFYWMLTCSFKAFGVNWTAARFPSILLGALTVLLTYLIGQRLFSGGAGLFSSMILATSFKFFKYARAAIPDMALLFFTTASLYFFLKGRGDPGKRKILFPAVFITLGLATLTKGPVGLIIPVLVIIFFILFSGERTLFKELGFGRGIFLYILVVAPWFLAMIKLHGAEFVDHVWTRELVQRTVYFSETKTGGALVLEYLGSLFFYVPIVIMRFLPWSLFMPFGLINTVSLSANAYERKENLFILIWFSSVFIFFSLMGEKHSQYMLALSVPLALILGCFFQRSAESGRIKAGVPVAISSLIVIFFIIISIFLPVLRPNSMVMADFGARILDSGLKENDEVAVGSHDLIPQKLEVYLARPVKRVCAKLYDEVENERLNRYLLKELFISKTRVYCLIKREDFERFIDPDLRRRLYVIGKDFLWKRKFTFGDRKFKSEYWLVTNKK